MLCFCLKELSGLDNQLCHQEISKMVSCILQPIVSSLFFLRLFSLQSFGSVIMCDDPDYLRTYIKILCKIYLLYKLKFKIKRVEIKKKNSVSNYF